MKTVNLILVVIVFMFIANVANAQSFVIKGASSPVVNLTSDDSNDTICLGTTVVFSTPSESSTDYEYFVDGASVQGPASSNLYMNNGTLSASTHEIIVVADNGSCSTSDTIYSFEVLPDINPTITNDDGGTVCSGYETVFRASGVNAESYDFRVNGTSVQSGAVDTLAISSLNDGDVVDVIIGNGECTSTSASITMVVNALPVVTLTNDDSGTICSGSETVFRASAGTNYDFQVNGVSVQNSAVDTLAISSLNDGDVVTVIVTNASGCEASNSGITMVVNPLPTWASIDGNPTPECVNTMVDVTMTGLTGAAPWTFNVYDDNAGNPGNLYYVVPGNTTNSNPTVQVPVPSSGNSVMHMQIIDANGCKSFPNP